MRVGTVSKKLPRRMPALLVLLVGVSLVTAGCDWQMYRYGPDGTGASSDTSISAAAVATHVALDWADGAGPGGGTTPVIANGVVYEAALAGPYLYAYDDKGVTNCTPAPKSCYPLWTAYMGSLTLATPAVVNGVIYLVTFSGTVFAYDAAGNTNCSGVPKQCVPLWQWDTNSAINSSPVVANGVLYVGSEDANSLYAFNATPGPNCTGGVTKICPPIWTAPMGFWVESSPAVVNGVLYVGSLDDKMYAFDASGTTNCSGSPKICQPLWTAATGASIFSSPAVSNGVLYIGSDDGKLYAFDAGGTTNCSGAPKTCQPLWTASTGGPVESSPAVANGVVYVGSDDHTLYTFDAAGHTNCSGSPKTCQSLWTAVTGDAIRSAPSVANGVVYFTSRDHYVYAFDATGKAHCAGETSICTPQWTHRTPSGAHDTTPVVSDGHIYVSADVLEVFTLNP